MLDFVHLHLHTKYSLADAMLHPKALAKRVRELGMKAVAITDHGVMFGVIDFYKACVSQGIKPILGMEAYIAPRTNTMKEGKLDDANYHLVLLAENNEGYANLVHLASDASVNGMYYKPRTDKHKLRAHHKGLIALSSCLGGEIQRYIMRDEYEKAKDTALVYDDIFGRGNFYLELQNHGIPEQLTVNTALIRLSQETGIPLICTNDCHYMTKEESEAHDVLMAIQAGTTIDNPKRKKYQGSEFYVKSPEEMYSLFGHIPEAMNNTVLIADRCNVEIEFGKNKLPKFPLPEGYTTEGYLRELVYNGALELYGELTQEITDRLEYEISVVRNMGYLDYFLIVWDFIRHARETGVLVGPGRGSGAGSAICYSLKITKVDPIAYNLLFERELKCAR